MHEYTSASRASSNNPQVKDGNDVVHITACNICPQINPVMNHRGQYSYGGHLLSAAGIVIDVAEHGIRQLIAGQPAEALPNHETRARHNMIVFWRRIA
ncbi:uncharacterized protein LDX57_010444 [Aspergillus melleus]|uniref:uncharacterized protein n=1 Tax=Aspergillus melleus TaxID=138277 RepID=UPI001E8DF11D|nr:uncharacterized protein LDX57_010444 [Aspergillus melleus]KAH8432815.1 hypothetical protein LDX57_010444 [Aspergillus melleus]